MWPSCTNDKIKSIPYVCCTHLVSKHHFPQQEPVLLGEMTPTGSGTRNAHEELRTSVTPEMWEATETTGLFQKKQ